MMKKYALIILSLFILSGASAEESIKQKITIKMSAKWVKLNLLVDKEITTIQNVGKLDPILKYRLLELYAEKLALIKERENKVYLQISPEVRKNKPQEFFFKDSLSLYSKTKHFGLALITEHPHYKDISHIYYTLGVNSRDYAKDGLTENYLLSAQHHLRHDTIGFESLKHKIKTSLAEYYYNEKKYPLAISYYNETLKNKEDNWYSKHLYNSGWCNFKEKKYLTAIEYLKEAHFVGKKSTEEKNNKYINISDQVMTSIGLFYVHNHNIAEGIEFYLKESPDPVHDLIKMAKIASEQGDFLGIRNIIGNAYQIAEKKENHQEKVEIRLQELEFYRSFKKDDLYFQSALSLAKLNKEKALTANDREDAVNKIKEEVGILQIKLNKDSKKDLALYKKEELERIINYFSILYEIDQVNEDSYRFYQGETYFSVSQYTNAAHAYEKAFMKSKLQEERLEIKSKILNSLLGTLSKEEFEKLANRDELTRLTFFSYNNYLNYWPKDSKAQIIYSKLFGLNIENKRLDDAILLIERYNLNFPLDIKNQRDQLTQILDIYVKEKKSDQLSFWINKLGTGYLNFEPAYIEKATEILGNILFEKFQFLEQKGQKSEAIKGHISLYEEQKYPKKIKGRAALNASILYLELGTVPESYEWQMKAFQNFPKEEIKLQLDKVLILSKEYALLQDFKHSALLAEYALSSFCQDDFKLKSDFFKQIILNAMIESKAESHVHIYQKFEKFKDCKLDKHLLEMEKMKVVRESFKFKDYKSLESSIITLEEEKNRQEAKQMIVDLAWQDFWINKIANKNFNSNLSMIKKYSVQEGKKIDDYLIFEKKIITFSEANFANFSNPDKPFEPEKFNSSLENEIAKIKNLTELSKVSIQKTRAEIILLNYLGLAESYYHLAQIIKGVTPNVPDASFVSSFKIQMLKLASNLEAEAQKYINLGREKIQNDHFITEFNSYFHGPIYDLNIFAKSEKLKKDERNSIINNLIAKDETIDSIIFLAPTNGRDPAEIIHSEDNEKTQFKYIPNRFKERQQ